MVAGPNPAEGSNLTLLVILFDVAVEWFWAESFPLSNTKLIRPPSLSS
jgi:hypothetical protein